MGVEPTVSCGQQTLPRGSKPSALPYLLVLSAPLCCLIGQRVGGSWNWLNAVYVFGLLPLMDFLSPSDKCNYTKEDAHELEHMWRFRVLTWAWVAVQYAALAWGASVFSEGSMDAVAGTGFVLSTGILGGISITVAHELGHKRNWVEKRLGELLLISQCYGHFQVEHVQGHHWNVATPNDPATSRLGESFYAFLPRSVWGGLVSAWRIEAAALRKQGRSAWGPGNRVMCYLAAQVALGMAVHRVWGYLGAVYFLAQAVVGFTLLEVVNYLEHYGLQRRQLPDGSYEPVNPTHSWNADASITNYVLFRLGRHSDHHAYPFRRYQTLRSFEESPNLPSGYTACIPLALVPPLWFRVMNPRVEEYRAQQAQRAPSVGPLR
eukprot:TRINITY_DN10743_c0_g1_i1.p2 TRINITY_DN10743_c0_g1~~TRINITY_DN10743_c0_g1_i1.p2  ORF type:complete len:401 (+),score=137.12 TRINITY_DN10743_c0_g1_i1:73-1203(+)